MNWDLWCNQAEVVPHDPSLDHGCGKWGQWSTYDGGGSSWGVTGWGSHSYDAVQAALGTDDSSPVEVWAALARAARGTSCRSCKDIGRKIDGRKINTERIGDEQPFFCHQFFCPKPLRRETSINRLYCHRPLAAGAWNQMSLCLADAAASTALKGVYAVNGRLHVNLFGSPEGEPITAGPGDMKPSWSKTGNKIVFFRMSKYTPDVSNWKNAICVVNADGSGFRKLTDGTHGDFNLTWSHDGSNVMYFNRRDADTGRYVVHRTTADANPGDEVAVSDSARNTFSVSSLKDGRLSVTSWGRGIQDYCFLLTPGLEGNAKYEPVNFSPTQRGMADRISISPSESKICYDFQKGFGMNQYPGRTIYIADFDVATRTVSNPIAISDLDFNPKTMTLYPCGTSDETAVVYHCDKSGKNQLYMVRLKDQSATCVSTNPTAGCLFACGQAKPN